MALLCAGVWAQQQAARPAPGERHNPFRQAEAMRQQAAPRADGETVEISFDVKLWDERVPKSSLLVSAFGATAIAYYDESSGLFTVECPKSAEEQTYVVECWDYSMLMFSKYGTFSASQSATVEIDMTDYHKVSFVADDPERWSLETAMVTSKVEYPQQFTLRGENDFFYAGPGEYTVVASFRSTGEDRTYYGAGAVQTFTLVDNDMLEVVVPYETDVENCHDVTFHMTGLRGEPMPNASVRLELADGSPLSGTFTDLDGNATVRLHDGEYYCEIGDADINKKDYYTGKFTVNGQDETVMATMDADVWATFSVLLGGSLVNHFIDPDYPDRLDYFDLYLSPIDGGSDYPLSPSCRWQESGVFMTEAIYVPKGRYRCSLIVEQDVYTFSDYSGILVEGNYVLQRDLSQGKYCMVQVEVVDGNGQLVSMTSTSTPITVTAADGTDYQVRYRTEIAPQNMFCLPIGEYTAFYSEDGVPYFTKFTVDGSSQDMKVQVVRQGKSATLDVHVKLPLEAIPMEVGYADVLFFKDDVMVSGAYMRADSQTGEGAESIKLLEGTYTYEVMPSCFRRTGTVEVKEGAELVLDYTADPYLLVRFVDEAGEPFDDYVVTVVYGETLLPTIAYNGYFGVLQPGTYTLYAESEYKPVRQTIVMGTENQVLDIPLTEKVNQEENFTIYFDIRSAVDYSHPQSSLDVNGAFLPGAITLDGIGEYPYIDGGFFYDVPAGNYQYTIQIEGYETATGTVEVSEATLKYEDERRVDVDVYLMPKAPTMGIGDVPAIDGSFRLFPTLADDALHILPGKAASGEWTVRITSPHGMTMYNASHVLDSETVLPVGTLPAGLYLLTIEQGQETYTYKFMKR